MKFVFLALLVSAVASQSCYDSSDSLIGTRCYKFINQKLSWQDAWNWCHSRTSYLATVDNTSNNFVASTARTIFNDNEGKFWIGLSRSNNKWTWDDGTPFAWFNWETQNSQNYATESIKNGKWNAYTPDTRLNFVCSYFPGGGPTPAASTIPDARTTPDPGTTSYVTPTDISCNPGTNSSTFLFAYSNDLPPSAVLDTWNSIISTVVRYYIEVYSWHGSIRFDIENMDSIQFWTNIEDANSTIANNLPDPNRGFQNSSIGSNVFDVIEKFFSNTEVPVCGSRIFILLKRYPNESDISRLVSLIRSHYSVVHVITSATPSGGSQPKAMYSVASKTNGIAAVEYDENLKNISWFYLYEHRYPVYATNIQATGSGTKTLPEFHHPSINYNNYWIAITYQDHVPDNTFQNFNLRMDNPYDAGNFSVYSSDVSDDWAGGTYAWDYEKFLEQIYSISLDYNYLGQDVQNIQIRFYSRDLPSDWLPYSD